MGDSRSWGPQKWTLNTRKETLLKLPHSIAQEAFAGVVGGLSSVVAQNLQLKLAPRNRTVAGTKGDPEILNFCNFFQVEGKRAGERDIRCGNNGYKTSAHIAGAEMTEGQG